MDITVKTFTPTSAVPADQPDAVHWLTAVAAGFQDTAPSDESIALQLRDAAELGFRLRGAYDSDTGGVRDVTDPVATLLSWDTTVNIGGRLTAVNAISDVTTRATHRRQGLLRNLMTADLSDAADRGIPLAALTVSEAGIYRRFGFGPAVQTVEVTVRTDASFAVTTPRIGRMEIVDRSVYLSHSAALFDQFHSGTSGSVQRTPGMSQVLSGFDQSTGKPDPKARHALHLAPDGTVDGAVAWFTEGDEKVRLYDLIAPDPAVSVQIWDLLGSLDLIRSVSSRRIRVDDPVRYALAEPDVYQVQGRRDFLWLRVLDVPTVMTARRYLMDDDIVIEVVDDLGFAAGVYQLRTRDGLASVTRTADAPEVTMDVAALGSILLGGVSVTTIAAAGHIRGPALHRLARLMLTPHAPASITPF
ncbi:GNAT family N-acetyltransferase [Williamsia sp. CHRR-6]|uniref:GNAT family N-acetyltransferase n=1 Tax=Williamsia sp. CHRR-6 TaxID=2835871 RepID=UPI001BDA7CD1|nr:GNAT family N-acetyltransferase [Williamsia sp. CHRR-6]MBT0568660.1 GNAT family N-acetyltransferase [Williamsia sp. CHRR-6]